MSATYNAAVKKGWSRIADASRDQLSKQMKTNLGAAGDLDSWMRQMFERNVDTSGLKATKGGIKRVGSLTVETSAKSTGKSSNVKKKSDV